MCLRQQPERYDVRGIFTTVTPHFGRVAIQATPIRVLRVQAERLGLPLYEIPIPYPCSNEEYEAAMSRFLEMVRGLPPNLTANTFAFGDLFLEDIRAYRESKLAGTGFDAIFPVWGMPTAELAQTMLRSGLKAIVTAVSPSSLLDRSFAGSWFDQSFLDDLPAGTDPFSENGEFHTCVVAGPMLCRPIPGPAPARLSAALSAAITTAAAARSRHGTRTWCCWKSSAPGSLSGTWKVSRDHSYAVCADELCLKRRGTTCRAPTQLLPWIGYPN